MIPIIVLLVTEAELYAAVLCIQDMLFVIRILNAIGLQVKLPMTLYINNKGAADFSNNWLIGGRMRHVE
eukprot:2658057-Ditylum_brightwellii.AAC.1